MGKNVICIPFAFKSDANTGVNIKGDAYSIYLKNACVALCSAKKHNSDTEVAFATNIHEAELPYEYLELLKQNNIIIKTVEFDEYIFPNDYLWSLAFYKLCVLKHLSTLDYDNICYLDTDVFVQNNLDCIWEECGENILLYDINHGLQIEDYRIICKEFYEFDNKRLITHFGGEFFAASRKNALEFIKVLDEIYNKMKSTNFLTTKGDEFLISLSAERLKIKVKNAGAYIYRYWTSPGFRLIATNYEYNEVLILHLPNEKNIGMLELYSKYIKNNVIPSNQKVWKVCRLSRYGLIDRVKQFLKRKIVKEK